MKVELRVPIAPYAYINLTGEKEEMEEMTRMYNKYSETPVDFNKEVGVWVEYETFTGEKVLYNDEQHKYTDLDGNVLLSGSAYAKKFSPVFAKDIILIKESKRLDVRKEDIESFWRDKGTLSADFGTAIHKLFELWFRYGKMTFWSDPKHSILLDILNSFPLKEDTRTAYPESMISSVKEKFVGTTDLLLEDKDKNIEILDYKIIPKSALKDDLKKYTHQMNFYRHILESSGRVVSGMKLCVYSGVWEIIDIERVEILK